MTTMSYPQMVQGIQLQTNEIGTMHDQTLMTAPTNRTSASSLSQFYHEMSKQTTATIDTTSSHNQFNQNDNLPIRSLSNTIEII